jgi:hypothetical protein
MRAQIEQRTMTIEEVNMNTGVILARDTHGTLTSISIHANPGIATIPAVGESWIMDRKGLNWFIEKRVDEDTSDLKPGDRRIRTSGDIILEGSNIQINGQTLDEKIDAAIDAIDIPDIDVTALEIDYTQLVIEEGEIDPILITPGDNNDVLTTRDNEVTWRADGYGTTLPTSAANGDEFILVDSLTAPSYAWRLKYEDSITDAYKWVCIGGSPLYAESASSTSLTTSWATYATVTAPRSGIYTVDMNIHETSPNNDISNWGVAVGTGTPSPVFYSYHFGSTGESHSQQLVKTFATSDAVNLRAIVTFAQGGITVTFRRISIMPIRIAGSVSTNITRGAYITGV